MIGFVTSFLPASSIRDDTLENSTKTRPDTAPSPSGEAADLAGRLAAFAQAPAPDEGVVPAGVPPVAAPGIDPGIDPVATIHAGETTANGEDNGLDPDAITCVDNSDPESICADFERMYASYLAYAREHLCFAAYRP